MATRLAEKYTKEVVPKMKEQFKYTNIMAVPKLTHVVVNVGLGKLKEDDKAMEAIRETLMRITGQKPVDTKSRKSISSFKVREGQIIGAKVTLRGKRMEEFIDKLINVTLPRVRDFRGIQTKSFTKNETNYTIGFHEHNVFPEIKSDEVEMLHGLEVTIGNNAKTSEEAQALFTYLGFPFVKPEEKKAKGA